MKIGIITQPLRYNYGGILQNYALQTVLRRLGHNPETLSLPEGGNNALSSKIKEYIRKVLTFFSDKRGRLFHVLRWSETLTLSTFLRPFIKKHIIVKQCNEYPKKNDYEGYIVGSDQVWRPMYSDLDNAYLSFASEWSDIIRVAYAASFGTDEWEYTKTQTQKYRKLVSLFNAVSVREDSGVGLCKKYFKIDVPHVLDPTLLLTKEDYINDLKLDTEKKNKGLFYYLLDYNEEKRTFVDGIAKNNGWNTYTVNSKVENASLPLEERIQPPVEEWLQAIIDADFVVTDSFHGMAFSINFNKPFVVIANKKRGVSRLESLLSKTGQAYRLLYKVTSHLNIDQFLKEPSVELCELREDSLLFLEKNLKK